LIDQDDATKPRARRAPENKLNDLGANEWLPETISVWTQRGLGAKHAEAQIERQHPAPYSFSDVARLVRFFTKRDQIVLDPFVGVGSTLKAAALEGRRGIGVELSDRYVALTKQRLEEELAAGILANCPQTVILGDAREVLAGMDDESVDFVVTSPPYWNILHKQDHKARQERASKGLDTRYGDDPRDLGNIADYEDFVEQLADVLGETRRVLKPKKYMAVVVSDFRDGSRLHMFHADLARALESRGFILQGITILYQKFKRIFPYGYPSAFVPNIHHQYILILRNGS
jgi:DNA modification methylase